MSNIIIAGVGGQGTLLASRILGAVAISGGYDVKVSEVHGMSQRGGSVITFVKFGEKVYSPIIDIGEADIILAFEELEALRWLSYLKPNGKIIVNTQNIDPMPVIMGNAVYPEKILEKISASGVKVVSADALAAAEAAGSAKAVNTVLLGIAARELGLDKKECLDAIRATVPQKTVAVNEKAFEIGYVNGGVL